MRSAPAGLIVALLAVTVGASSCGRGGQGAETDAALDGAGVDAASPCGPVTGSCASNMSIVVLCTDYTQTDTVTQTASCLTEGTWAATPCDRGGTVRGCLTIDAKGCTIDWYGDAFEAQERCVGPGTQLIIP
ncbi:MAG TPA: hypothetical protein VLA14_17255 [Polyangia bacterium]|jgi:hypothetical protein|nr:hypothetical protein [Polyangia bacterium]